MMKTVLASAAGVEDGFFQMAWERFPNLLLVLTSIGIVAYLTYRVVMFFMGLQQKMSILELNILFVQKSIQDLRQKISDDIHIMEEKIETRFVFLERELTLRFQTIDERFRSIDDRFRSIDDRFKTIDDQFKAIDERFNGVDGRFNTLENKIDRVIDILLMQQNDKSLSSLRKS